MTSSTLEHARSTAYHAVWALTDGSDDPALAVSIAQATCSAAFTRIATDTIQVHGGIGFTWEHQAHLYYKRAYTDAALLGSAEQHRARVAELVLDAPPPRTPRASLPACHVERGREVTATQRLLGLAAVAAAVAAVPLAMLAGPAPQTVTAQPPGSCPPGETGVIYGLRPVLPAGQGHGPADRPVPAGVAASTARSAVPLAHESPRPLLRDLGAPVDGRHRDSRRRRHVHRDGLHHRAEPDHPVGQRRTSPATSWTSRRCRP